MTRTLQARLVESDDSASFTSPRIGVFTPTVTRGQVVTPGMSLGRIVTAGEAVNVVAPDGGVWRVVSPAQPSRLSLAWGAPLVGVERFADDGGRAEGGSTRPDGGVPLESPMEGQFYRRSAPDVPVFAEVGQTVRPGDQIGLIEVMKFFYPFTFQGTGPAVILSFEAEDGKPIEAGAPVAWLRPLSEDA